METVLKATSRDGRGKGPARRLRAEGKVPGVLYGHGVEPVAISLSSQDLLHFFHATHGAAMVVDLEIDGTVHLAIPREIQRDHLRGRYVHIDFLEVRRDEKVKMSVEIHETGEAPGVKTGGVIEHHLREVEIECLPGDVPEQITADVGGLELGDMLRLADITAPSGVTFLTDLTTPVISVVTPAALRTEADLLLPGEEAAEVAEVPAEESAEGAEGAEAPAEPAPEPES
jgi:large subunit ribosomal protein L25